ncbi:hypothetical protein JN01_0559 [Entomoplasma freundtii]|uniref:Uncharacterized protein n=1 Tax=Entomoplasma freundtii TaxID=74700 RepID=A0A2K8NRC9_9MOLU|nr:hypothetical protein [Entomoplasma freundtii]ATZ16400.1 hypothetical protein EFREU_v1c03740 [Entomoplasma freundtii]TDY56561.1 hypothetical protein JN01_0559 [Entomoplasma freundtii]
MGNPSMTIVLLVVLVVVIIFVIVTTITGRKASKKEKAKRYQEVRNQIKDYIATVEKRRNLRIEFEKVYARKGAEYKYRDVFDVIVELIEPKTNKVLEVRAYEIEGLTTKIDKKNYKTDWVVNGALELEETKRRIAIAEKEIKLTKSEKQLIRQEEKVREKELKAKEREELKTAKIDHKKKKTEPTPIVRPSQNVSGKFIPTRKKTD